MESIRVVVFTSGPSIRPSVKQFVCRLEDDDQIDLVGVFWQTPGIGFVQIAADAWKRRKLLAIPALLSQAAQSARQRFGLPMVRACMQHVGDRIHPVPDLHADAVLEQIREISPDLGLVYGSPILRPQLFLIPRHGTLGIHHGKLPEYRGKKTLFWAMYNGEPTAGVTIQRINEGLDTGEIVREGTIALAGRTLRQTWRELELRGYDLYLQAIHDIRTGSATFRLPEGEKGRLFRDPKIRDLLTFYWKRLLT